MVELEEPALVAANTLGADERTLLAIALMNGTPRLGWHMARAPERCILRAAGGGVRVGRGLLSSPARAVRDGELLLHQPGEQGVEGPVDHLREVARGQTVAQQRLGARELVVRGAIDRELQREPLRRERRGPGRGRPGRAVIDSPRGPGARD